MVSGRRLQVLNIVDDVTTGRSQGAGRVRTRRSNRRAEKPA